MAWPFRRIPSARIAFEIVHRTRDGRFALAPKRQLVKEWIGILAVACARWGDVQLHQVCTLSNHVHMIVSVKGDRPVNQLARWTSFVFGNTARVSHAVHGKKGIRGPVWDHRAFRLIPIADDASLRKKVKYLMAQATSAHLVARPNKWPGLNSIDAVCRGALLKGFRANAALRRRAKNQGVPLESIAERKTLTLAPLPSQVDWTPHARQRWYRDIEKEVIAEADAGNAGIRLPTIAALRAADPMQTRPLPRDVDGPPKMHVDPANHAAKREWQMATRAFVNAWREALARWLAGAVPCFPREGWVPFGGCSVPRE
ncbi:MAG: REP element-mobilizing transposase RayT [Bradymonadia bacterium]|jgi:REP element-mobilizing transposase RayT